MANVRIGYGASVSIKIGAASPVELAEVISIGLPDPQVGDVEATHFKSADRAREYIAGLKDNGEIPIGINFEAGSATDDHINDAMAEVAPVTVVITVPTSTAPQSFSFPGIIKGYSKAIPIDDRQTAIITVRVAGAVAQAAVAP